VGPSVPVSWSYTDYASRRRVHRAPPRSRSPRLSSASRRHAAPHAATGNGKNVSRTQASEAESQPLRARRELPDLTAVTVASVAGEAQKVAVARTCARRGVPDAVSLPLIRDTRKGSRPQEPAGGWPSLDPTTRYCLQKARRRLRPVCSTLTPAYRNSVRLCHLCLPPARHDALDASQRRPAQAKTAMGK